MFADTFSELWQVAKILEAVAKVAKFDARFICSGL